MKMKLIENRAVSLARRRYLLECRTKECLPTHIYCIRKRFQCLHYNSSRIKRQFQNILDSFQFKLLNIEITDINIHIKYVENKIEQITKNLNESNIPNMHLKKFLNCNVIDFIVFLQIIDLY